MAKKEKVEDYVIITYEKEVYDCEECEHSEYDNGIFVCCSPKLSKKYMVREIEEYDGHIIPKWCPYRRKRK